jgi:tetratricopeptide (TPR) repeat protein
LRVDRRRGQLAIALLALLCGCAPTLRAQDLPLSPSRVLRLAQELERSRSWRELGWFELIHRGRSGAALTGFERALREDPGDLLALTGRAIVLHDQARYPEAGLAWHRLLRSLRAARPTLSRPSWDRWSRDRLPEVLRPLALRKLSALLTRGETIDRDLLELELRDPEIDPLSHQLAAALARRLHQRRQQRGGASRTELGCPRSWSVTGPLGQLANLDDPVGPAAPSRLHVTSGCRLILRSGLERGGLGGVFELATEVTGPPGEAVLSIESDAPWKLVVDGTPAYAHDPLDRRPAGVVMLRLHWPRSGTARLGLRVAAASGAATIAVSLFGQQGREFQFQAPGTSLARGVPVWVGASAIPCAADPARLAARAGWPAWYLPLADYLSAEQAAACGDNDRAYDRIASSTRAAPAFAAPLLLGVVSVVDDEAYPEQISVEQARRALTALLARDPALGRAAYNGAILALRADETDRALRLFQDALKRWPRDGQLWAGLARVFRQRGWSADEENALTRALQLAPGDCSLIEDLIAVKQLRRDAGEVARLVRRARECDAGSEALARRLREAGQPEAAAAEYLRLAETDPGRPWLRREAASALAIAGRAPEAIRELERMVEERIASPEDLVRIADLKVASGDRPGAIAGLRRAFERAPWLRSIRGALERLEGRSPLQAFRVDGKAAIAAHLRRARRFDAPAVLVQDRMVARIFEGGGKLMLIHNIIQVLSKEGIERWGELRIPEGAEVLTLRSVKADGSTREPEEIGGKRTVSLPDLEVGDFVEIEYVDSERPLASQPGTRMQTFHFASFDVPIVLSEYLVVAPRSLELTIDRRGNAPREQRSLRGNLSELRFTARDQGRVVREPRSVAFAEYLPSVQVAAGASWERVRDAIAERVLPLFRSAWPVREMVRRLVWPGAGASRSGAERLYREVLTKIAAEGPFLASAARSVAQRSGSRYSALIAVLREAGIAAELWLVRPRTADQTQARIPSPARFVAPLVYCPLPDGPVFLDPRDPAVPFGSVPIELRGAPALRLARGRPPIDWVPLRLEGSQERRAVQAKVKLEADGTARVEVVEDLSGSTAIMLRATSRKADPEQLRKLFEGSVLNYYFPGAVLDQLAIDPDRDRGRSLRLSYSFRTGNLARIEQGALQVKVGLFAPQLSRFYLGLARRERALQVAHHVPTEVELLIAPPPGFRPAPLARVQVQGEFGRFRREATASFGGRLRIATSLEVEFRRIAPADLERFARFARSVDDHFQAEARFIARP